MQLVCAASSGKVGRFRPGEMPFLSCCLFGVVRKVSAVRPFSLIDTSFGNNAGGISESWKFSGTWCSWNAGRAIARKQT